MKKLHKSNIFHVKFVVGNNRKRFEADIESMDDAEEYLAKFGPQEDAWALICPESEAKSQVEQENEDEYAIPDLQSDKKDERSYNIEYNKAKIPRGH